MIIEVDHRDLPKAVEVEVQVEVFPATLSTTPYILTQETKPKQTYKMAVNTFKLEMEKVSDYQSSEL